MKYKVGQIVKIKTVRSFYENKHYNRKLTKMFKNCLATIRNFPNGPWYADLRFTYEVNSYIGVMVTYKDIIPATEREAFLYYIYGSEALRKEIT